MAEKKVKFHPLERLDLVDLNALQDLDSEYTSRFLGSLFGDTSGLLKIPLGSSIVVDNSTDLITFPDFTYLERDTSGDFIESHIVSFDSSDSFHGTCSFDTVKASVQAYYNSQGTIPTDNSTNAQYYPFIWVKKGNSMVETTQDNRRFWNASNGSEETQNVNTRKEHAISFIVSHQDQAGYTKIARIKSWLVLQSVVILPLIDGGLEFYTVADSIYFSDGTFTLDNTTEFSSQLNNGGGLHTTLQTIRKQISDIRGNGTVDSTYNTSNTDFNALPLLSLDGLYYRASSLESEIRSRKVGQTVLEITVSNINDSHTLQQHIYSNNNQSYVITPTCHIDYSFLYQINSGIFPLDFSSLTNFGDSVIPVQNWTSASSLIAVDVGSTYNNYGLIAHAQVVSCLLDDYNTGITDNLMMLNSWKFKPMGAFIHTESQDSPSDVNYTGSRTYRKSDGTTDTVTGFKVGLFGLDEVITESNLANYDIKITVKIDFTLINP